MIRAIFRVILSLGTLFLALGVMVGGGLSFLGAPNNEQFDASVPVLLKQHIFLSRSMVEQTADFFSSLIGPSSRFYVISMTIAASFFFGFLIRLFVLGRKQMNGNANSQIRDPLFENKLMALALVCGLILFSVPVVLDAISGNPRQKIAKNKALPQYRPQPLIEDIQSFEPNAGRGERRAVICKSCHTFEKGGAHLAGPNLWNIVGRDVASVEGFRYSAALQDLDGVWTEERLDQYLLDSQAFVPGTVMFQKVRKAERRADIIAYLKTLRAE